MSSVLEEEPRPEKRLDVVPGAKSSVADPWFSRGDSNPYHRPLVHVIRLCDFTTPLLLIRVRLNKLLASTLLIPLNFSSSYTFIILLSISNFYNGTRTQVRRTKVRSSQRSHAAYPWALPGLCLSLLRQIIQHCLYLSLAIDQTEIWV